MRMEDEKYYRYWLHSISGLGGKRGRELAEKLGSAGEVYRASENRLKALTEPELAGRIVFSRKNRDIAAEYEKLLEKKINFTYYGDLLYPERLKKIPDAPSVLYYKGRLPDDELPAAAVIGARACSEYGKYAAREFGYKLAAAGIQIISGLAMGIDGISQEAALKAGGESFGVLGCGVDICYPRSNRALYERLEKKGGLISEYPPGTEPKAGLFPPRNRIISGLADLVLVIEAREKSGTLITVDMALEQGREVFAMPGRITDALSGGCNRLICQGAGLAASPEDILEVLGKGRNAPAHIIEEKDAEKIFSSEKFTKGEKEVFFCLDILPKSVQDIYEELRKKAGKSEKNPGKWESAGIQEVMVILVELCLKGLALQDDTGGYMRKKFLQLKKN